MKTMITSAKPKRRPARRPLPPPKPYHHGDLKRVLIDAALGLVEEDGVEAVSVREAARRAGVSQAAPYRHFVDKRALLGAIAEEGFRALTQRMLPTLERVAGRQNVFVGQKITGCEDFSYYQQKVPGFFYFIGITPRRIDQSGVDLKHAAPNHSPRFFVDESGLLLGVRSLAHLTLDYMASGPKAG